MSPELATLYQLQRIFNVELKDVDSVHCVHHLEVVVAYFPELCEELLQSQSGRVPGNSSARYPLCSS
jgi:hypothetical protein